LASLFKQTVTRPLPAKAELFDRNGERFARWTAKGKKKTAKVIGDGDSIRIQTESTTWYARVRMADGSRADIPTRCKDRSAAMTRMSELVAEQEKIRAGVITQSEAKTAKHGHRAYADTVNAYIDNMVARGRAKNTRKATKSYLESVGKSLGWRTLRDIDRAGLERWLSMRATTPKDPEKPNSVMGARTHNAHVAAFHSFGTWCLRQGYVKANPFAGTLKRDERADRRRVRRAVTTDELTRLLEAARMRPLQEAMLVRRGEHKGELIAKVSPETEDRLLWLGVTRAMAYLVAASTGLRWGELRSITIGALQLDANPPHMVLEARNEKARRGDQIPLRADVATAMRHYVSERRSRLLGPSADSVTPFPGTFDNEPVFEVPEKMHKVFDADCAAAGIPKKDGAGRAIDVHALRHTFGTNLAKAGVPLQVAQHAMRHSNPALTSNVYTHLGLLDVAGAVEKLPSICVTALIEQAEEKVANLVTPTVTPTPVVAMPKESLSDKRKDDSEDQGEDKTMNPLSIADKGLQGMSLKKIGGGEQDRTVDLLTASQALSQTELHPHARTWLRDVRVLYAHSHAGFK